MSMDEQIGRLEGKMDMMIKGQDTLTAWCQTHAENNAKEIAELNKSVSGIKGKLSFLTVALVALAEGGKHAVMSMFGK